MLPKQLHATNSGSPNDQQSFFNAVKLRAAYYQTQTGQRPDYREVEQTILCERHVANRDVYTALPVFELTTIKYDH